MTTVAPSNRPDRTHSSSNSRVSASAEHVGRARCCLARARIDLGLGGLWRPMHQSAASMRAPARRYERRWRRRGRRRRLRRGRRRRSARWPRRAPATQGRALPADDTRRPMTRESSPRGCYTRTTVFSLSFIKVIATNVHCFLLSQTCTFSWRCRPTRRSRPRSPPRRPRSRRRQVARWAGRASRWSTGSKQCHGRPLLRARLQPPRAPLCGRPPLRARLQQPQSPWPNWLQRPSQGPICGA